MNRAFAFLALSFGMMLGGFVLAESASKLDGIKCPVSGAGVDESKTVEHKDGLAYFCCGKCAAKFAGDKAAFETKANHQLVATKQYEQGACPFSGGELNPETKVSVAGTKVAFCCNNCKGKVEKMKDEEKLEAVFSKDAFAKAKFVKVEPKSPTK